MAQHLLTFLILGFQISTPLPPSNANSMLDGISMLYIYCTLILTQTRRFALGDFMTRRFALGDFMTQRFYDSAISTQRFMLGDWW